MPRVKFCNHHLVLFSALFATELWTHSTTPAEDEPWGIRYHCHLTVLTSPPPIPPHPSTPSIFWQIPQGRDRMGLLAQEHGTAACSFPPDILYLWSLGIASHVMVQIPQRSTIAPVPTSEVAGGASWCRVMLAIASTGSTFFWACLWGTVLCHCL